MRQAKLNICINTGKDPNKNKQKKLRLQSEIVSVYIYLLFLLTFCIAYEIVETGKKNAIHKK